MNIRQKIIGSFFVVITLLVISIGSVFLFHSASIKDYQKIANTLILEHTLSDSVSEMVEAYTAVAVAPQNQDRLTIYLDLHDYLLGTFKTLDTVVVNPDSRVAYLGLKNIILAVIEDLEAGRLALEQGDIVVSDQHYNKAIYKKSFVESNATLLVVEELRYLRTIQGNINDKYKEQLIIILMWITAIVCITTLYALLFARRITSPLKVLSLASEKVSGGDYSLRISSGLLNRKDELGILSNSFNVMLKTINSKITQIEAGNKTIIETKERLEERNETLERFNQIVVGRELKMVELKDKIAQLEQELKSKS